MIVKSINYVFRPERLVIILCVITIISVTACNADISGLPDRLSVLPTASAIITVVPEPVVEQTPTSAPSETERLLLEALLPERDQRLLAMRLRYNGQEIPKIVREIAIEYQLNDTETFWVTDLQVPPSQVQITAILKYKTAHSYWWVDENIAVDQEALRLSAEQFEDKTYPTNRAFFGNEWSPGIDGDVRIHLFLGNISGAAGYFSAVNEYSKLAEPHSNEREMFFVNATFISSDSEQVNRILAHEFQHMIHWYQDRSEVTWVNEGLSELAVFINNYGNSSFIETFTANPDVSLTNWNDTPSSSLANYGGSFLFMVYFMQQYGEDMTRALVSQPGNGIAGFNAVLADNGYSERFNDIFADFLTANYLNNDGGRWGYENISLSTSPALAAQHDSYPVAEKMTVNQYGADYIELSGEGDITVQFTGSNWVKVIDNNAHSGSYQWYSHRGDDSNSRLSRAFDLRDVNSATLNYWTWYDIEADWDYGYVEISTNGGKSWQILQTTHSITTNLSGNAYGAGYSGISTDDNNDGAVWIEEQVDISAYAGQEVAIRFEYVTDDAVNRPGWTVDDISIPEIDFYDDAENGLNGWQAEGFVLIDNLLPQRFLVQVLEIGTETKVRQISLDADNIGSLTINNLKSDVDRAILIVSGLSPVTSQLAEYEYKILQ